MAQRIYVKMEAGGKINLKAFESKDELAKVVAANCPGTVCINKDGNAFSTWSVAEYVGVLNSSSHPIPIKATILTAKEFGQQSFLSPAGRKLPNVIVSYDKV